MRKIIFNLREKEDLTLKLSLVNQHNQEINISLGV